METNNFLIILKLSLSGLIIFFSVQLQARENGKDSLRAVAEPSGQVPTTSFYVELGGKFLPSFNIDFRKKENFSISVGSGFWKDSEEHEQFIFIPSVNLYYLSGKRKRIEMGGGAGPFLTTYKGLVSCVVFGSVGYRYQKKKGLFFRAGFTPFVAIPVNNKSRFLAIPWAGVSLGYSL